MRNTSDPSVHRQREQEFVQHVHRLLQDDRLRVDTTRGRRPVTSMQCDVNQTDGAVQLKRLMSEMNRPDRELEQKMPVGQVVDVLLSRQRFFIFKSPVGRVKALTISPTRQLLAGEEAKPLTPQQVTETLRQIPPSPRDIPTTIIIMSTSGFTIEAHEAAERRTDRTVILVEPNDAGGWSIWGPAETKALTDLFDPEADAEKRQRIRDAIDSSKVELFSSGLATDKLAARTQLPIPVVEAELKTYARENPGLVAKRLDGKMVLFRESSVSAEAGGGVQMPFIDKMKALFARKGETEKKIAFLSERRAALSQQRDRGYEEMNGLEQREGQMREEFKTATNDITKRRITSQLLQLRKDIERRQQLLTVLNQQVNVVSTNLHNLELLKQGKAAHLPDSEEMAADAAAAEDVLADLQASNEMADSVGGGMHSGMSEEEQALFDELESQSAKPEPEAIEKGPAAPVAQPSPKAATPTPAAPAPAQRRPSEPEAG